MKNKTKSTAPIRSQFHVLRQICHLIPVPLAPKLARETGVEPLCRTFSAWSHCVAMLFAQFTHALGLNDGCDSLRLHSGPLSSLRAATPPSRNNLSHASRHRPALLAETLFWSVLGHWQSLAPGFARGRSRLMCSGSRARAMISAAGWRSGGSKSRRAKSCAMIWCGPRAASAAENTRRCCGPSSPWWRSTGRSARWFSSPTT